MTSRDQAIQAWTYVRDAVSGNEFISRLEGIFNAVKDEAYLQGMKDEANKPEISDSSRELAETFFKEIQVKFMLSEAVEELAKRIDAIK